MIAICPSRRKLYLTGMMGEILTVAAQLCHASCHEWMQKTTVEI